MVGHNTFRYLWFNSLRVYYRFMNRYWRQIIKNQLKQLFLMINSVTQSRVVSNVSHNFSEKRSARMSLMHACVWHHISVCVQQIAQRSCLTFPLTALNFSQCQDCQRARMRESERGRWGGKGEGKNHVRRWGWSEQFESGDGVCACMFWHCNVSARSPHHHLVMCDEGQACLWAETLPEAPHSQPHWFCPGTWIEASPNMYMSFCFQSYSLTVCFTSLTTIFSIFKCCCLINFTQGWKIWKPKQAKMLHLLRNKCSIERSISAQLCRSLMCF